MWQPVDLFTKAKTSVPVLLYTTEQICVAHFFVQLFKRWHASIIEKEHSDDNICDDAEVGVAGDAIGVHLGHGHELSTV
jgi:sodium/bile acid cotransporter 7